MIDALRRGLGTARREPALVFALVVAMLAPSILGVLPLELALSPHLDLRPAARALVEAPADDGLVRELLASAPSLPATGAAGLAITIVLGVPAAWIIYAFVAARALSSRISGRAIVGRGLGAVLLLLPVRVLPMLAGAMFAMSVSEDGTLAAASPHALAAVFVYGLGASLVTVITDFVRGVAIAEPARPLLASLGGALRAITRSWSLFWVLVFGEVLLGVASVALVALSRPLGLLSGLPLVLVLAFLVLRATLSVAFVAAAATGAAIRSA